MPSCNEKDREYTHPKGGRLPSGLMVARELAEFLKGEMQMYEKSCASSNHIKSWKDIDFGTAEL